MTAPEKGRTVELPCGCIVTIGQREYAAVCEPHRLGQEADARQSADALGRRS
jgi:hypothetical protein